MEQIFWIVPKASPCFILKALLLQGICRDELFVRIWIPMSKQVKIVATENLGSNPLLPETEHLLFLTDNSNHLKKPVKSGKSQDSGTEFTTKLLLLD